MASRINTTFNRHLFQRLFSVLLLSALAAPLSARECDQPDARQEAACLRQLVGEMKQDMQTLINESEQYKDKVKKFEQLNKQTEVQFNTVIDNKNAIINKQDEIIGLHVQDMELASKQIGLYKTCCLGSAKGSLRIHVGIGATGSDTEVAGMVGIGLENFNVFGFVQKNNTGLMLGYQF